MKSLTEFADDFINETDEEYTAMFNQGLKIREAIAAGHKPADVRREFGIRSGRGKTTITNRELVATVFGDDYAHDMDWSLHLLCCQLAGSAISKPDTFAKAHEWLDTAIKGYPDQETGNQRPHSVKTLKEHVAAAAGNRASAKPEVVFTGEIPLTAMIVDDAFNGEILVQPERYYVQVELPYATWQAVIQDIATDNPPKFTITRKLSPPPVADANDGSARGSEEKVA